jgi:hypothetical protein
VREAELRSLRANGAGAPDRFKLVPFRDIVLMTSPHYLVRGVIPRDALTVIWGPPKCGKSFWAFDLLMHVATGTPYRGRKVVQGPVVYVACEGERGLGARVTAYKERHQINDAPFYLIATRLDLVAHHSDLIAAIRAQIGTTEPVAIVIDTLNRSIAGSESKDEDMGAYVGAAEAVREAFGCAVLIVHHCGVDGNRPRGHTSLTGATDAQLAVKRDRAGLVSVEVEYMKDGEAGGVIGSRLEPVVVGTDDEGDPISSCVVVQSDDVPGADPRLAPGLRLYREALVNALADHGERRSSATIPSVAVVSVEQWKAYAIKSGATANATTPAAVRSVFSKARKSLLEMGIVREWDGWVWLCATERNLAQPS